MIQIYEIVSLYEIVVLVSLAILSLFFQNTYIVLILSMLMLKIGAVKGLKQIAFKGTKINRRPKEATNCNILNQGGSYREKPGFPSGHTTMAVSLFTFLFLQWIKQKKDSKYLPLAIMLTGLFAILIPIARIGMKCHTTKQVMGGVFLGMIWGGIFSEIVEPKISELSLRFFQDKEAFWRMI